LTDRFGWASFTAPPIALISGAFAASRHACDNRGLDHEIRPLGSAPARRRSPEFDSSERIWDFIDCNVEAERLGFHSTFVVEHHFMGFGMTPTSALRNSLGSPASVNAMTSS
jgi:hypothetical protein